MITHYGTKKLGWIDVENPTRDDITELIKTYNLHPVHAETLLTPTERAKVDPYDEALYVTLHYPNHPARHTKIEELEIDFVIMQHMLITVHYEPVDVLIDFARQFQVDTVLDKEGAGIGATGGHLFFHINNLIYQGLEGELELVRHDIKKIESAIFEGNELRAVEDISILQRRLLDFKQAIRFHENILKSFESNAKKLFGKAFELDEETIHHEHVKVQNLLENERELLSELRRTNDSLLTAKNNDVTKRLTLMAFVTFPLTLVATVLGMGAAPELFHGPHGFWIIVGILVILFVMMHAYFTYKEWI